ncbi:MAG TPA: tetratricopeptide repeat protein [Anaeromyxobacter sp.]|nr:tetratricopeptide repeat protein [Anaeromyxobacter sp.]
MARGTTALTALAVLLALAIPGLAGGQVPPPRLVEDDEEQEPAKPAAPPTPPPAAEPAPPPGVPAPGAPAASVPPPAAAAKGPLLGPPVLPAPEPARRVVPVQTSWAKLMGSWAERRRALREGDPAGAEAAQKALLAAQQELGIENLFPLAAAEVRAVSRALASNLPAEALSRAEVAVTLAPDWPESHLARARALLASSGGGVGAALGAVADAVAAAWRDPQSIRALRADLFAALLAAVAVAALFATLLPAAVRLPLFLHDFHHLPLVRGTASVQAAFLALVLLATPLALGLGPLAVVCTFLLFAWLYLSLRERLVATAALLCLFALPLAAARATAWSIWTGTLADRVQQIEHGALSDEEAAAAVKELPPDAPAPLLAALGRHMRRRGDLDEALKLYRAAAAADPHAPEVQVDIGNVLFLKDDLDGARASYLAVLDRAEGDLVTRGTAAYDLSKLFVRTAEMEKSSAARANAEQMAGAFLARHGSDEDFSANRYLVDVPVPHAKVAALLDGDPAPGEIRRSAEAVLLGPAAGPRWRWVAGAMLALLWGLALASRRLDPVRPCFRCGRPVCRRCDGATGRSCGQCVNVFEKRGLVEPRDQARKERQVRRHTALARGAARVLAVVGGGCGHLVCGAPVRGALFSGGIAFFAFLAAFWSGVAPPVYPSAFALPVRLLLAASIGLALWAWAIRDLFRRTGG